MVLGSSSSGGRSSRRHTRSSGGDNGGFVIAAGLFSLSYMYMMRYMRRRKLLMGDDYGSDGYMNGFGYYRAPPRHHLLRQSSSHHLSSMASTNSLDSSHHQPHHPHPADQEQPDQQRQQQQEQRRKREETSMMSSRGRALVNRPLLPYLNQFLVCLRNECCPVKNPTGHISLCTCENKLVADLLAERFMDVGTATAAFGQSQVYAYNSFLGMSIAREAAAYFIARRFLFPPNDHGNDNITTNSNNNHNRENGTLASNDANYNVDDDITNNNGVNNVANSRLTAEHALAHISPSNICIGSGVAALLSHLCFLLGSERDACLIPAPYYAALESDINLLAGVIPFPIKQANPALGPTIKELDLAYLQATSRGLRIRFLLLNNPNNPMGTIYSPDVVLRCIEWARLKTEKNQRGGGGGAKNKMIIHTICDEIYALSTHQAHNHGFQSVIKILDNQLGQDVHFLWGVSKDFGACGLRVGFLYTQNQQLIESLATVGIFTSVSTPIQYLVSELLTDDVFVTRFLAESRQRLLTNYQICRHKLEEMVIPYVQATAGMFVYVDFSSLLPRRTFEYEQWFGEIMFTYARVVLTPGESQRDTSPGMYRICYAWVTPQVLEIAMERLSRLVAKIRRLDWDDLNAHSLAGIIE